MKTPIRHLVSAIALFAVAVAPAVAEAAPFSIPCPITGDAFGFTVATGGDFDGDGTNDIAVGAPCFYNVQDDVPILNAGRVVVYSGVTGRRIFTRKGQQDGQFFGVGLAFIPNRNPNGKDKLAIGSPGYDLAVEENPINPGQIMISGGKVEVYLRGGGKRLTLFGQDQQGGFGEAIAGLEDVSGNDNSEMVIGAGGERNGSGARTGRLYIYDSQTGELISSSLGPKVQARFGSVISILGDTNDDGVPDIGTGSPDISLGGVSNSGLYRIVSSDDVETILFEETGAKNDRMGADVEATGDLDGDGLDDAIVGSFKTDDAGLIQSGAVNIVSSADGTLLLSLADEEPQDKARFGAQIANIGDVTGDGVPDFVASAPDHDVPTEVFPLTTADAGRLLAFDGVTGATIWDHDGFFISAHVGSSLAGGFDFNGDGIGDVLVGARGDTGLGRRHSGRVRIHSGADGRVLRTYNGRHGFETRIYVFSSLLGRVLGFDTNGTRKEFRARVPGPQTGSLSVAMVNDGPRAKPGEEQIAASGGQGAPNSNVVVYDAGEREEVVDEFFGMPPDISGGVNVAAGNLGLDDDIRHRIATVQADSTDGRVLVQIFRRLGEGVSYFVEHFFEVYLAGEEWFDFPFNEPLAINASGANIVVGDVLGDAKDEIIVAPITGIPLVRVFDNEGNMLAEWLAYDPVDFNGVELGIVDVRGTGQKIVTVPVIGEPQIKVFNGDGTRVVIPGTTDPIFFIPEGEEGAPMGRQLSGADVDFDDQGEILYMTTSIDSPGMVLQAFEADGTVPLRFTPFVTVDGPGAAIDATDRFVRK